MIILKTEHLNYKYSEGTPFAKTALTDINIEIEKGSFLGLIGHTGSGKSTLVQHFNGLLKPTAGKIYVDGQDIWQTPKQIRRICFKVGLVFQYPEHQLFDETVEKDIAFGPRNMELSEDEIQKRVKDAAEIVGLSEDLLKKSPFDLSGGEKRRAALAGVLAMQPEVLVLDEPTAGLDPKGRDTILERIKQYQKDSGTTVVLVSHSMEDVAKVADKVLVMNKNVVAMYDTVEQVFSRSDELSQMGLAVPSVTKIFMGLKKKGIPVNPGVFTVEQGKQELMKLLPKGGTL
ncbi:MAG: energy-coupling factor transporter ATPase [Clostridiales bacterium 43-6]|nr:MAG: energy-coupling factor transporter ATPase [Clostridiales bacterium 43-6]